MAQDIRELMKQKPSREPSLPAGHEARFEARLEAAFGSEKTTTGKKPIFLWMKVAAIAIVMIALGTFGYNRLIILLKLSLLSKTQRRKLTKNYCVWQIFRQS